MAPRAASGRGGGALAALLACAPFLFGCAADTGGRGAAMADPARFDGAYQGRRVPTGAPDCRARPREVWFDVSGGAVAMRAPRQPTRGRRRPDLAGTVSADGSLAMRQGKAGRAVAGRIEGDRLTAEDAPAAGGGDKRLRCAYRYEATRVSLSGVAAGPPPVEGLAQP